MEAIVIEPKRKAGFVKYAGERFEDNILSGKQAASRCNAVPLELFISELHRRVDNYFQSQNVEAC